MKPLSCIFPNPPQAGVEKVAGEEWLTHGNFGPLREAFQKFLQGQSRGSLPLLPSPCFENTLVFSLSPSVVCF